MALASLAVDLFVFDDLRCHAIVVNLSIVTIAGANEVVPGA